MSTTDGASDVRVDDNTTEGADMVNGSAIDGVPGVDPTASRNQTHPLLNPLLFIFFVHLGQSHSILLGVG